MAATPTSTHIYRKERARESALEREKKHALRNAHRGGVEGRARIGGASAVYNLLTSHNTQKTIFKREKTYNAGTRFVCFTLFVIVEEKREREDKKCIVFYVVVVVFFLMVFFFALFFSFFL